MFRSLLVPTLASLCAGLPLHLAAAEPTATALDQAVADLPKPAPRTGHDHHHGHKHGDSHAEPSLRLIDISLAVLGSAGTSTANNDELGVLKAGGHDPKRRGFTLQGAELALSGAVDPFFTAEAALVATPDHGVELEEASITTTGLPYALEAKGGYHPLEFGRVNSIHGHAQGWLDQPVVASRILGADGSRSAGARLGWLVPAGWYSQVLVGVYNADDESLASFLGEAPGGHDHHHDEDEDEPERTIGGRLRADDLDTRSLADLLYLVRFENAAELGEVEAKFGLSMLTGPNAADGRTQVYGADLTVGGHLHHGPFAGFKATIEGLWRRATVPESEEEGESPGDEFTVPAATLNDWGVYAQVELQLDHHWSLGLRGEYASGSGRSVEHDGPIDRDEDGLRDTRIRVSPLVAWRPSEFSRLRLQYDYDHARHLEDTVAHSVWLGLDVLIGAHPPHGF